MANYKSRTRRSATIGLVLVILSGLVYALNPLDFKSNALSFLTPVAHADSDYPSIPAKGNQSVQNPNSLDPNSIASKIQVLVNQDRQNNGVKELSYDSQLALIALSHSKDMVENNFFSHYNKDNDGPPERAAQEGYYCHKDLGDGYYTEGISENIAMNLVHEPLVAYYNGVPDYDWLTEDEIAEGIFTQWKTSPANNENMLEKNYDKQGLGLIIAVDGKVYATANFC